MLPVIPTLISRGVKVVYAPQQKVGIPKNLTAQLGDTVTLNVEIPATSNNKDSYQWYKDNNPLTGATGRTYQIASYTNDDSGVYFYRISNSDLPDLVLESEPITLNTGAPTGTTTGGATTPPSSGGGGDVPPTGVFDSLPFVVALAFIILGLYFYYNPLFVGAINNKEGLLVS